MSNIGPCSYYLGIKIIRDREKNTIYLSQQAYIQKLLNKLGFNNLNPTSTPIQENLKLLLNLENQSLDNIHYYQTIIGSLLYLSLGTRMDIMLATTKLAKFASNPSNNHLKALKQVLRYLKGTKDYILCYKQNIRPNNLRLIGYSDANQVGDKLSRKLTSGYAFYLNNSLISQSSKQQPVIALSSCASEYIALTYAAKELIWLRLLLRELGYNQDQPNTLLVDNQASIVLANNPAKHATAKHIDIRYHFIREQLDKGIINLEYIPSTKQLADGFTKALPRIKFQEWVKKLGLIKYQNVTN